MQLKLIIITALLCFGSNAQNNNLSAREVFQKAIDKYKKQNYLSLRTHYKSFKHYTDTKPSEIFYGETILKNDISYSKVKDVEIVTFNDYVLQISNSAKTVVVDKNKIGKSQLDPFQFESYLKNFETKVTTDSNDYICTMIPKKFAQIMLNQVVIYINKHDFTVRKQEIFLLKQMPHKNSKGKIVSDIPKIEMIFSMREKKEAKDNQLLTKSSYFKIIKNNFVLAQRFSNYKLINAYK